MAEDSIRFAKLPNYLALSGREEKQKQRQSRSGMLVEAGRHSFIRIVLE